MTHIESSIEDVGRSSDDRLLNSLAISSFWPEQTTGFRTDASGRWKYRSSILLIVTSALALWGGIYVLARILF